MKSLHQYKDYKEFVIDSIAALPNKGYGQMRRLASHLKIHTTLVSQIFRGTKHLTLEHACHVATFLGLNELDTDLFVNLVELERAGTGQLKTIVQKRIEDLQSRVTQIESRVGRDKRLTEQEKAVFYSDWIYSGARLVSSIKGNDSAFAIAERLGLPRKEVIQAIEFLLRCGLMVSDNDKLQMGPKRTHLEAGSSYLAAHHRSWRLKSLARAGQIHDDELMYTAPLTISKSDAKIVRTELLKLIESTIKRVTNSEPEEAYCFGIDFCKF
ncbi:MAG: TIGR02147 family protein [Oligoflexales bacterium]